MGNVGDVVRAYEATVQGSGGLGGSHARRADPPRSQKHFSEVTLARPDGMRTAAFQYGDVMRLLVAMKGRTPHRTHFVEWFLNERTQGHRVAWGATHALPEGDIAGDAREVAFLIGPLPLAEGSYSISLAMGVAGVIDLDFWQDAIAFEVGVCDPEDTGYGYTTRYAPTFIPYELEIT